MRKVWDELKGVLARLREQRPNPLTFYPSPDIDRDRRPPFKISLEPWAVDVARQLDERFGADVQLQVGALTYPVPTRTGSNFVEEADELSEAEFRVELDGPLRVRSGHTKHHQLLVTNLGEAPHRLATNGQLTAQIAEPATGNVVGGFAGLQPLPMVMVTLVPQEQASIPLLVGTASYVPDLGYAIPSGQWAAQATLRLFGGGLFGGSAGTRGRVIRTSLLPITVID